MNKDIKYFSQYSPYTPICEKLNINFENLILSPNMLTLSIK